MDISNIVIAGISLLGTIIGTFGGILTSTKLSNYRIEQLEKKVEKHNSIVERTYVIEGDIKTIQTEVEEIKQEIHLIKSS